MMSMESDVDPFNDPYSPYFLHNSDNPTSGAVTPVLDGTNYHVWSRGFIMSLSIRNKLSFIDVSLQKPSEGTHELKAWNRRNTLILSWLLHSVGPEIRSTILYLDDAKTAWDKLKVRYEQPEDVRVFQLQQALCSITQGKSSVTEFFTKLSGVWEELNNYNPIPYCECDQCLCDVNMKLELQSEKAKVFKFLMGLNETFEVVRGQLILADPTPTMDRSYSMVLQEEKQKQTKNFVVSPMYDVTALAVGANNKRQKQNFYCTRCKRTGHSTENCKTCDFCKMGGHTMDTCYKIHGYPESYKGKKVNPGSNSNTQGDSNKAGYVANVNQESKLQFTP